MTTHLEAAFTLENWQNDPQPAIDGGPDTGRGQADKVYSGDLDATSTVFMLLTSGDGGAAYLAQERIDGALGGREGTFVLQHGAIAVDGETSSSWATIVPGSGTGELGSLAGAGRVEHGLLVLDYTLD